MSDGPLAAGPFGAWLGELAAALRGEGETDVACGSCTACCRASQFVHIDADEADALAHIPASLVFPAPGAPAGTMVMGYDRDGRCPMLGADGCTIYEHRPRTCRTYDCRVFAATGVYPDEPEKADIAVRARRWVFDLTDGDEATLDALRARAAAAPAGMPATAVAVSVLRRHLER